MEKKGMSVVIASILLVMIVVVSVSFIYAFLLPWIRQSLDKGKSCFELREKIAIEKNSYTCYNSNNTLVMISVSEEKVELKGLVFLLENGEARRYEIYDGVEGSLIGVRMYNGSSSLKVPEPGEAETYVFNVSASSVEVAPVTKKGELCQQVEEKIDKC